MPQKASFRFPTHKVMLVTSKLGYAPLDFMKHCVHVANTLGYKTTSNAWKTLEHIAITCNKQHATNIWCV